MSHTDFFYNCPVIEDKEPMFRWLANSGIVPLGSVLEFGVGSGNTLGMLSNLFCEHLVYGFDSFEGLPEDWDMGGKVCPKDTFACPVPNVPGAEIIKGEFKDTLPNFDWQKVALAHIDCDLYNSTKTVLDYLGPFLVPGSIIICDELRPWAKESLYPNWYHHEAKAMEEFGYHYPILPFVRGTKYAGAYITRPFLWKWRGM